MKLAVKIQFALILFLQIVQSGTPVKVTFQANTCGVPDMLDSLSTIQIRGSLSPFTWDYSSAGKMKNARGEYWKLTVQLNSKETLYYNYFTNAKATITASDSGWEADISDWGNGKRRLIVGDKDTTLPLEFINGFKNPATQWEKPFATDKEDTIVCFLRVNMVLFEMFDSSKYKVGIRGSFAASNWGTSAIMKSQHPHANVNSRQNKKIFFIAPIYWKKSLLDSSLTSEQRIMRYKFVIHNKNASNDEDWSLMVDNPDQQFEFTMPARDTIPIWSWYRGPKILHVDTVVCGSYNVSMRKAIQQKSFNIGDSLFLERKAVSWSDSIRLLKMNLIDSTGYYNVKDTIIWRYFTPIEGMPFPDFYCLYRYVIVRNGIKYFESFVDSFSIPKYKTGVYRNYQYWLGNSHSKVLKIDTLSIPSMNQMPFWTNIPSAIKLNFNLPLSYSLSQNYPNPFNPSTMINYQLPTSNLVTLKVFDIVGREVATLVNERQEAESYQTSFNAQGLSSGLYFYQLRAGNYSEVKKMVLLK